MNPIKKNKDLLKDSRAQIQDFLKESDSIFEELCLELGVKENDPIKDNVFDYLFNNFGSLKELEKIWNKENKKKEYDLIELDRIWWEDDDDRLGYILETAPEYNFKNQYKAEFVTYDLKSDRNEMNDTWSVLDEKCPF